MDFLVGGASEAVAGAACTAAAHDPEDDCLGLVGGKAGGEPLDGLAGGQLLDAGDGSVVTGGPPLERVGRSGVGAAPGSLAAVVDGAAPGDGEQPAAEGGFV